MKKIIVGLGEVLWDMLPSGKVLGGAPANFVYHASQFGLDGYVVSAIGKDLLGEELKNSLIEKHIKFILHNVDYPTGKVQVTLNEAGIPQYEICENVAWDKIPFTSKDIDLAKRCNAVCFGSLAQRSAISRATILRFLEFVPDDSLKIVDINLRQHFYTKEIIHNSLLRSNVLKINDEELLIVANLLNYEHLSEEECCRRILKDYNLKIVIETKGAIGSYVFTKDETSYMGTPKVCVADTVGAGDAFTGAFVAAILNGSDIRCAHQFAVNVSAYVCTQNGATPKLPEVFISGINKKDKVYE
jgi:fructokinase